MREIFFFLFLKNEITTRVKRGKNTGKEYKRVAWNEIKVIKSKDGVKIKKNSHCLVAEKSFIFPLLPPLQNFVQTVEEKCLGTRNFEFEKSDCGAC